MGSIETPKITLYTNHGCPWAHRAQIALHELKLPFETVIIDLATPRTPEYLKINPRGLVPALDYNGTIIVESAIVAQFLVDAHPSHLEKSSTEEGGALQRAQINFFVDTFISKLTKGYMGALKLEPGEEKEKAAESLVDGIVKEIEPLLSDAAPFFGGSSRLTLAEVQTGSFVLRLLDFSTHESLLPKSFAPLLQSKAPNFWKWASAVVKEESVTYIWDKEAMIEGSVQRFENARKATAAK